MKVKTINYQKVFPLAQYVNERIGVEIELSDGDNEEIAFLNAKELVHSWAEERSQLHDSSQFANQEREIETHRDGVKRLVESTEERRIGDLASDIKSCTDVRVLETYRLLVQKKPEFKAIYDEMHTKLSKK